LSALTDILYANLSYIAVPVFFQISLFLFYFNSEKSRLKYFLQKRLPKLISLYLFWLTSKIVWDVLITGESGAVRMATRSLKGFLEMIVSGGNSPFYFFFSLIFITTLAEIFILVVGRLSNPLDKARVYYYSLFGSCVLIFVFSIVGSNTATDSPVKQVEFLSTLSSLAQWNYNPLNFLPYIFTAAIVAQEFKEQNIRKMILQIQSKLYFLATSFLAFTLLEWYVLEDLIQYSRISLVLGSWLLLYLAILSTRKPASIITFISNCSLGLYAFHLLFTHVLFSHDKIILSALSQIIPGLDIMAEFFIALIGSIVLTLVFRKSKWLKNFA